MRTSTAIRTAFATPVARRQVVVQASAKSASTVKIIIQGRKLQVRVVVLLWGTLLAWDLS